MLKTKDWLTENDQHKIDYQDPRVILLKSCIDESNYVNCYLMIKNKKNSNDPSFGTISQINSTNIIFL